MSRQPIQDAPFLLLVAVLALILRLAYLAFFVGPAYVPELDAAEYHAIATSLANGHGFALANGTPTAIRPPLFPLLLAGIYRLFGNEHHTAGLALQALIGVGISLATYGVGRHFGLAEARLAALIAAGYPLLIFVGGSLLTEPLFILLVTLAMGAALALLERPTVAQAARCGLLLGLAGLARPNGLLLAPFLTGWVLLAGQGAWRQRLVAVATAAVVALVVTAPWVIRNFSVFRTFVPSTTMGGAVLFGSYNERVLTEPALYGDWVAPCEVPSAGWTCALSEQERDVAWRSLGTAFIREHMADLPRMVWWRFIKFWHLYAFRHGFPESLGFWSYVAVAVLAIGGMWALRDRWRAAGVLLATIACFMISALMFWGGFRMRVPAEPALIVLAAAALAALWRRGAVQRLRQGV